MSTNSHILHPSLPAQAMSLSQAVDIGRTEDKPQLGSCKRPDAVLTVFFSACEEGWALGQVGWAGQGRAGQGG